jgi:colanic acid biosynthesis glycosyl transferase WcaI
MRVLLIAQYYAPEDVAAAVWIPQLAEDLRAKGNHVTVLTAFPNYPRRVVFEGYRRKIFQREKINGVEVIRTWIYANPSNAHWSRVLNWGSFCLSALLGGLFSRIKADAIYVIIPPLPLGMTAILLGKIIGAKVITNVQDIYPLIAVQLGILKNPRLIRLFEWMEGYIYRHSKVLVGISEEFVLHFRRTGAEERQVVMIPNWADSEAIKPQSPQTLLRKEIAGEGKTIVLYSGTLSHNSCTEVIVQAAERIGTPDICFLIVGDGVKKEQLQQYVREKKLTNVIFRPFQPLARYSEVLATGDIALVTLNTAASPASVPSKVFKHMAAGRPIIAITKSGNELQRLITNFEMGIVTDPDDINGIARAIARLSADRSLREKMGANARLAIENHFARPTCIGKIENILKDVSSIRV